MSLVADKARELGEVLQNDPVFAALEKARTAFEADKELQENIERYNTMQQNFGKLQEEEQDQERLNNYAQTMLQFRDQILENENMAAYNTAKENFDAVIQEINNILYFYMTGEEPESCTHDCTSCGGGCH